MKRQTKQILMERVAYSPFAAKLAFNALHSRLFQRLPPYRLILGRHIAAVKRRNAEFPLAVSLDSTTACNARCIMCPNPTMTRPKGVMGMDLYRKIVDECAGHEGLELSLSGFGEPLLDRRLVEKIAYAKGRGIEKVVITTNASLLDEGVARGLIDAGLDEIIISVDGWDRESYERTRVGLRFDEVYGNIRRFRRLRGDNPKPRTIISTIIFEEYAPRRRDIIRLWRGLADHMLVKPPEDWAGQVGAYKKELLGGDLHLPCPYLWARLYITWNGVVAICCMDLCDIRLSIGDVTRQSIYEIWHGEELGKVRAADAAGRTLEPCRECGYTPNWWSEK